MVTGEGFRHVRVSLYPTPDHTIKNSQSYSGWCNGVKLSDTPYIPSTHCSNPTIHKSHKSIRFSVLDIPPHPSPPLPPTVWNCEYLMSTTLLRSSKSRSFSSSKRVTCVIYGVQKPKKQKTNTKKQNKKNKKQKTKNKKQKTLPFAAWQSSAPTASPPRVG